DMAQHGVADLWSPPLATLSSGRGDCEDYAIAKYAALRAAGTPDENLRLLLVRDRAVGQDHAVLAVRHADVWLVLDNRYALLKEASELSHFSPLFALNHGAVKLFAAPYVMRGLPDSEPDLVPATPGVGDVGGSGWQGTPYLL